jgi:hypothetical protein
MLPSITGTASQGAQPPTPCETTDSKHKDACNRTKNPTGEGCCCIECGDLATIKPVTGLSLDIIMIENFSPSMDSHAKLDGVHLREGVPSWQAMVNCDGSYKLEEHITPHKSPRVLQTLMWITTIAAGTPHQLVFAGGRPIPMGAIPRGGVGSHPESSFCGSKVSMPLYAAKTYAAQMRVMLPSILAPFGLPQPSVTVLNHTIRVPPTGVKGWKVGETLSARAWRQAPGLVTGRGGNSTCCGHIVVANGANSHRSRLLQGRPENP